MQAKLLRVLQQGEFEPAGSTRTRKVDVRIVAATSRDLEKDVRESRFRHDLFFRLNVSPIPLPPLRRRGQDVVLLAEAFVEHDAKRLGRKVEPLSPASVRALESYAWPGNVRELRNVIERAVIVSTDGRLDLSHLLRPAEDEGRILTATEFQALERDNLRRALEACGGRVSGAGGAAAMLGMRPSTLSSRMKTLKLKRP